MAHVRGNKIPYVKRHETKPSGPFGCDSLHHTHLTEHVVDYSPSFERGVRPIKFLYMHWVEERYIFN